MVKKKNKVLSEDLTEKVTFWQSIKGGEEANDVVIWDKRLPRRRNRKCKGPKVRGRKARLARAAPTGKGIQTQAKGEGTFSRSHEPWTEQLHEYQWMGYKMSLG